MQLGAVQLAEHAGRGDEDDAPGIEAGLVGEGAGEKRLACAGRADEERVDALVEEVEIVEGEVAGTELLASRVEVEVEGVDVRA